MTEPEPLRPPQRVRSEEAPARHVRRRSGAALWTAVAGGVIGVLVATIVVTSALTAPAPPSRDAVAPPASTATPPPPAPVVEEPVPLEEPRPCDDPAVIEALEDGTDAAVIAAVGGGEAFRAAVAGGAAPCLDLADAERIWVVVNKRHPLDPIDYWPVPQARAESVQRTSGGHMRADVAGALAELAAATAAEGPGAIGVNSGFRSYDFQVSTYRGYVASLGQQAADGRSARPGHSEHQTGLAVDVVACSNGCGGIETFGQTPQSEWVAANAWRFGFIVRYEDGHREVTGYDPEPWHLRYLGEELAAAYHDGGYHSLEAFFGLDPAPDYLG